MKTRFLFLIFSLLSILTFNSCLKQEYFKSEKEIKKELLGTWQMVPIPRFDTITNPDLTKTIIVHNESWTFDDAYVTILNYNQTSVSTYSINTSFSKAEFKLDGINPPFYYPARIREINGTWRIVKLDGNILVIANDQDGTSGLTQLEFQK